MGQKTGTSNTLKNVISVAIMVARVEACLQWWK